MITIVSPMFLNENLTEEVHLNILWEAIDPIITEEVENERDEFGNAIISEVLHFQHDGLPSQYARTVRDWLSNKFLQACIGKRDQ